MKIEHWGVRDGIRLARTVGKELSNPSQYSSEEFIIAGESALKKFPNEWVIHYSLADKYQELGYYAEGIKATQECFKIRPKDISSAYALASAYNLLTRAAWTEKEDEASKVFNALFPDLDKMDKRYSQAGLDRTGLAVETAAVQAIRWFEHCLTMKTDLNSKNQINQHLNTLYKRFPNLKL
ncbi:MAG: hypothetical protein FVQ83_08190 [Chloroflexi bacterium]|nr:hypothetical protein [Chloroflexota bacterium]